MTHLLRKMLEVMGRRMVFTRRSPKRFGALRLTVSPGAALCYFKPLNSRNHSGLLDFSARFVRPDSIVWDVGANTGVFGFAAAWLAGPNGRVLCIEADPWSVELLRKSMMLNRKRVGNVDILHVAVSDKPSLRTLHVSSRTRSVSHLADTPGAGEELTGGIREQQLMVSVSLDWLAERYPPPDVLKIDVEGAELMALRGGEEMISGKRPVILAEVSKYNADAVARLLRRFSYRMFDADSDPACEREINQPAYNTLALPWRSI